VPNYEPKLKPIISVKDNLEELHHKVEKLKV
jgi:hypothetical protein